MSHSANNNTTMLNKPYMETNRRKKNINAVKFIITIL